MELENNIELEIISKVELLDLLESNKINIIKK